MRGRGIHLSAIPVSLAAGRLAQLVEHIVYTDRVGGSSPSPPTNPVAAEWQQRDWCRARRATAQRGVRGAGAGPGSASRLWNLCPECRIKPPPNCGNNVNRDAVCTELARRISGDRLQGANLHHLGRTTNRSARTHLLFLQPVFAVPPAVRALFGRAQRRAPNRELEALMKIVRTAVTALALCALTNPAWAGAPCATSADQMALKTAAVQQQLMVAAFMCHDCRRL